jgi:ApbE superfamily uncharacterized protein (UPF0280 family)
MTRYQAHLLPDGRRLHLNDGPIDLVIEATGEEAAVRAAYHAADTRFATILDELCDELSLLRQATAQEPKGITARRMWRATLPFSQDRFITPMAAVAGSVAEEILAATIGAADLERAYVNNGGDIALHLPEAASFRIGLIDRPDRPSLFGYAEVGHKDPVRGIATSGWRGRSFSLGIADAVTVLAKSASSADDLGHREVTCEVGALCEDEIDRALRRGCRTAEKLVAQGLLAAAALHLKGETRIVGDHRAGQDHGARIAMHA